MVVAQVVEHAGSREAQDQRRVDHAEHDRRQHQVMQPIAQGHTRIAVARHRKPAERDGEDLHQDEAEPETRDACAQHREPREELIDGLAAPYCRDDAAGNTDERRDQDRKQRQEEGWLRAFGQRLRHRPLQKDRLAQIAVGQLAQPVDELQRQRLVEPVRCAQLGDVGGSRLFTEHHRGGIAGREPRDEKHDRRHQQHHDHHACETRCEIPGHGVTLRDTRSMSMRNPHFTSQVFQKNGHGIATYPSSLGERAVTLLK